MQFGSSLHPLPVTAEVVADALRAQLGPGPLDLVIAFTSQADLEAGITLLEGLASRLQPGVWLACTAENVIGAEHELEGTPALSVLAARLPGVHLTPFDIQATQWGTALADPDALDHALGLPPDCRGLLLLGDPFTTPIDALLDALNAQHPGLPVFGGMASLGRRAGDNMLAVNGTFSNGGAIGLAFSGPIQIDLVVSQGCRPIGSPLTVTAARQNLIHSLDEQPPVDQIRALYTTLTPRDQALIQQGLFIGRLANAPQDQPGRGDYLIRGVLGIERETGALAIADRVTAGERVQFHVRDAETASEDLDLLLVPQTFGNPPAGALLFSCNGRGTRLYDHPDGDIRAVAAALNVPPLAGFFAAGELGPIGSQNFLHSHTASLALFRPISGSGV